MQGFTINWSRSCTRISICVSPNVNCDRVNFKSKDKKLKYNLQIKRKNFHQKSLELSRLKFSGKVFVSQSMCFENRQLAYKCRKLKNSGKNHST